MKVVLFANTEWYLYNFRRSLAFALRDAGHEVLLVSASSAFYLEPLKARLRLTDIIATRLDTDANGALTGRTVGFRPKAELLELIDGIKD